MSKYNKAYTAVVAGLLSYWSTYAGSSYNHWLPLVVSLLGALGVYSVRNGTTPTA
jgi:hypothetical protein